MAVWSRTAEMALLKLQRWTDAEIDKRKGKLRTDNRRAYPATVMDCAVTMQAKMENSRVNIRDAVILALTTHTL